MKQIVPYRFCMTFLLCILASIAAPAKIFTTLVYFGGVNSAIGVIDGEDPLYISLVQGPDGNLYGTTGGGGDYQVCTAGCGTVFKVATDGVLTTLHTFKASDGTFPHAGLTLGPDGAFYGTTYRGGASDDGTVFRITSTGNFTRLHSFDSADGASIEAGLVQASDGNLYGTTYFGGKSAGGTVYRITPGGTLTTIYNFCSVGPNCFDGASPTASLIQATDGNLYGTTTFGGPIGHGTVFKVTLAGTLSTVYSFCAQPNCIDGAGTTGGVIQGKDGNFYGTTGGGGANDRGTVFRLTPDGQLTTIYDFCSDPNCPDGSFPYEGVIQASDGMFYGMTTQGGDMHCTLNERYGCGTVYRVSPDGDFTLLHAFGGPDGGNIVGGLFQATDGKLYGTAGEGGRFVCIGGEGCGTIFVLDLGLQPFVSLVRGSGRLGTTQHILGQGLAATTEVSFNGVPAKFWVVSDTLLKVAVPAGATTGYITVRASGRTLKSNKPFRVAP